MRRGLVICVAVLAVPSLLWAGATIPHAFSNGTLADAAQINANFAAVAADRPGSVITTQVFRSTAAFQTSALTWQVGPSFTYSKTVASSDLLINGAFPFYIETGNSGFGLKLQYSLNNSTWIDIDLPEGPAHGWGSGGYGGHASGVVPYLSVQSGISTTGTIYFRFLHKVWNALDTLYFIGYPSYPKQATWTVQEIAR